ncbi:AAA family ATPase [Leucothrix pacifica]|nr:AAA family ATPase [Leucothrix pacifica]
MSQTSLITQLMQVLRHAPDTANPDDVTLLETHISWIILTGRIAYKLKKPVNLGFLDFTTLANRKHFCEEELRLNARLAADLYLGVETITGNAQQPVINGEGPVIDYAIRMRQFPQSAQLDKRLEQHLLLPADMEALGAMIARFHQQLPPAEANIDYGSVEQIHSDVGDNLSVIKDYFEATSSDTPDNPSLDDRQTLTAIEDWVKKQNQALDDVFAQRKQRGFIRECHGDLHLRNLIWLDDHPVAFDCLEFDESLRWIDVMCEIAFLVMDLMSRDQDALAYAFLNHYLQQTGDYQGLTVLPYYISYRAMVRAKVDALRHQQSGISPQELAATDTELHAYMNLALRISQPRRARLIITRGMSASGKSTISQVLSAQISAIRIRSDVERKRLYDLEATESAASAPDTGLYSKSISTKTYTTLLALAEHSLAAGFDVIVDAVFMHHTQRRVFQELAEHNNYDYVILEFTASPDTLRQRIVSRVKEASDADLTVLEHQLSQWQPLQTDETKYRIEVDTEQAIDIAAFAQKHL